MKFKSLILMFLLLQGECYAENLGVIGEVFPIKEPDLLREIHQKLEHLQQNGELKLAMKKITEKSKQLIERPKPNINITTTTTARVIYFDPSIMLSQDILDGRGNILWKMGEKVNPLKQTKLNETLVFFNADDQNQVKWAVKKIKESKQTIKPILIQGDWVELMKDWHITVYFDQRAKLAQRLHLSHVPCVVTQEGQLLKIIEEVPSL